MNNPICTFGRKISVIVPIYNVERYVETCVKSIIGQDYKNLEIILVDDGSPDACGDIIDRLGKTDARIKPLHKKNEGVSAARNTGLDYADGDYIIFIDGDDYIERNYVSHLVWALETTNADMACAYRVLYDDELPANDHDIPEVISAEKAVEFLYLNKLGVAVWNKIYRSGFLKEHHIRFKPEFWFAEGMTFNIECFQYCGRVGLTSAALYHQVSNMNSAVRKFNLESWHCGRRAMLYQKSILKIKNERILNAWNYHYREYNYSILKGLLDSGNAEYDEEKNQCIANLKKNISYPLKADIGIRNKMLSVCISLFPAYMAERALRKEKERINQTA